MWKFLSLRELEAEQMEPPAQRATAELGRVLGNDLSWRSSFPGLVDIRTAMLRELWDHMGSFSQELHQVVWMPRASRQVYVALLLSGVGCFKAQTGEGREREGKGAK